MKKTLLLFSLFILSASVTAKVLTDADLTGCKKIAIIAGTYDPFTTGHEGMGKAITSQLKFDCVVYLPTQDPPHKIASPFKTRYEMIEAALKEDTKLFYPSEADLALSPKDYVKKLKGPGNAREIYAVLGSDLSPKAMMYYINEYRLGPDGYIITGRGAGDVPEIAEAFKKKPHHVVEIQESVSSTQVRKWFVEHDEVYFNKNFPVEKFPNDFVHPEVSKYIQRNALYLGSDGVSTRGVGRILKTGFTSTLNKVGLYHPLREIMVKRNAQDALTEVVIEGKTYPLKKHLGSGLTADAYIFQFDGQDHVIKIANQRLKSPASILQDVKIGQWLNNETSIKVPPIQAVDPDGKWKVTTLVKGESLGTYLANRNGYIEPDIKKQLQKAVEDMVNLSAKTNIKLDLSIDNLKIWNGQVYLIDAGPIPPDVKHPMSYQEFTKIWSQHTKIPINNNCANVLKAFLATKRAVN